MSRSEVAEKAEQRKARAEERARIHHARADEAITLADQTESGIEQDPLLRLADRHEWAARHHELMAHLQALGGAAGR